MAGTAKKGTRRKGAKTIARAYFEALAKRDLDAAQALWRPGGIDRLHGLAELRVPGEHRAYFQNLFAAFPDFELEVVDVTGAGDRAAVRWRGTGTFNGTARFQGLNPNGSRIEIEGCDMLSIEEGEIVENNAYLNGVQLGQQLGAFPQQGSFGERAVTGALNARTAATEAIRRLRERD